MISKKLFHELRTELKTYDSQREDLIGKARGLLKESKHMIYEIHRGGSAPDSLRRLRQQKAALDRIAGKNPLLFQEGSYSDAVQEYCEAETYHSFVSRKPLPTAKQLKIGTEDYLMGLCDLTGELTRRAVRHATMRDFEEVKRIKQFVEDLYGEFIHFDLRNGLLRKKYDAIKWNLKKLEEIMYDIFHPSRR